MAKIKYAYFGSDSYGRNVEAAVDQDGKWFCRRYEWNGFGKGWSKWESFPSDEIKFSETIRNTYDGSVTEREDKTSVLEWGFNYLRRYNVTPRYRLPSL